MVKKMLKVMMLILAVCMLPSCIKYIPCPDPLPVDIQKQNRTIDGTLKHIMASYAPEDEQVGNKVEYTYEDAENYRDRVSYGISFKQTWEDLVRLAAKESGVFDKSSTNKLMLEIDIKELYAPEVHDHFLYNTVNHDAHVSAHYTVKDIKSGKVLLSTNYSAIGTCDKYDSRALWQCAANPNIKMALNRAIAKVNNQFISDLLNVNIPESTQEKPAENKVNFWAETSTIVAQYSKSIADAKYGLSNAAQFNRSKALSDFEKMLKLRVINSQLYTSKSDHKHKVYATITDEWHDNGLIFIGTPQTSATVEFKVISTGAKQKDKVIYQKSITKKIDKMIGDRSNYVPDVLHCLDLSLDEFMKDMHELAKKNPGI
ncbi:hypothetical protein [Maridesulfovibrio salexigens]|uniref:Lipoprotein n=1 Tax=Maridesulfovibrio salexigens (strain ATCC 14822 / DSM 2638 / NCIMB 8403 / VKM B-1763) TaxID=526222 RepID=C6BTE3_MARSD|nr:hypothetical protein [Maridesulfovibrio salexigens]ACS81624.1 hypothetical protein Desal_3578 [Maridesulfovibrio salexigens DSM 2638]